MKWLVLAALLTVGCGARAQESIIAPSAAMNITQLPPATSICVSGQSNVSRMQDLWSQTVPDSCIVGWPGAPIAFWDVGGQEWSALQPLLHIMRLKAFAFWDGETDAENGMTTADFLSRLQSLMARVRLEQNNPTLRLVIVQILDFATDGKEPQYAAIRAAQAQFVSLDVNARLVNVDDQPQQWFNPHLTDYTVAIQRIVAAGQ